MNNAERSRIAVADVLLTVRLEEEKTSFMAFALPI
jgi:hypothetical protein